MMPKMSKYAIYLKYINYFFEKKLKDDIGPIFATAFLVTFIAYINLYLIFDHLLIRFFSVNQNVLFLILLPILFFLNYYLLKKEEKRIPEKVSKWILTLILVHILMSLVLAFLFPPIINEAM